MSRLVTFWQKRGRRRRDGRSPLKNFRRNLFLSFSSPLFLLKSIYYFIFFSFLASPGRVLSHSKRQQWWRDGRQCSIREKKNCLVVIEEKKRPKTSAVRNDILKILHPFTLLPKAVPQKHGSRVSHPIKRSRIVINEGSKRSKSQTSSCSGVWFYRCVYRQKGNKSTARTKFLYFWNDFVSSFL